MNKRKYLLIIPILFLIILLPNRIIDAFDQKISNTNTGVVDVPNNDTGVVDDSNQETINKNEIKTKTNAIMKSAANRLSSTEIIVYDGDQLKQVIEDKTNGIETIYFGANIYGVSKGIEIGIDKMNLTINGSDPTTNKSYKYFDYPSASISDTMRIQNSAMSTSKITLKNMDIAGDNYYGSIYVSTAGATVVYDNINYVGPQIIYNKNGKSIIKDSTINIPRSGFKSPTHEVGEAFDLVFQGQNKITHDTPISYPSFRFSSNGGSIVFDKDASLTLNSNANFTLGSYVNFNFIMNENSTFDITNSQTSGNFIYGSNGNFEMKSNSTFKMSGSGSQKVIDWGAKDGIFKMTNANLTFNTTNDHSVTPFNFANMDLKDSKFTINNNFISKASYINANFAQSFNNSTLEINQKGTSTAASGVYVSKGGMKLTDSKFNINAENIMPYNLIDTDTIELLKSDFNFKLDGGANATLTSTLIKTTGIFSLNESNIKIHSLKSTGNIINASELYLGPSNNIDLYTKELNSIANSAVELKNDLLIGRGTVFKIHIGTINKTTASPLLIDGSLTIMDGSFHNIVESGAHDNLVYLKGSARLFYVAESDSVLLYGPTTTKSLVGGAYSINFWAKVQQINTWNTNTGLVQRNLLDNLPQYEFRKKTEESVNLNGNINKNITTIDSSNMTSVDGPDPKSYFSLASTRSKIVSFGKNSMDINKATEADTSISGKTGPNGAVNAIYYSKNVKYSVYGNSDNSGNFSIPTQPLDLRNFDLFAVSNFLYTRNQGSVIPKGSLKIIKHPINIDYGKVGVPTKQAVLNIKDPWDIQIKDDRGENSNWRLYAKVTKPMNSDNINTPKMDSSFVFVDKNQRKYYFKDKEPLLVAESINGITDIKLDWTKDQGVKLEINPGNIFVNQEYSGEIEWILSPL